MMEYIELKIFLILKKDIHFRKCGYVLGSLIGEVMSKDKETFVLHQSNRYKNYCFDYLYPISKDGVYKTNNMYNFNIHTINKEFAEKLKSLLDNYNNDYVKIIMTKNEVVKKHHIDTLKTITPLIITLERDENGKINFSDLMNLRDIVIEKLVIKYSKYIGEFIDVKEAQGMFYNFKVISSPICLDYKGIKLCGIKVTGDIAPDTLSQNLAFFSEAVGLGEKNSAIGAGFVKSERRNDYL